MRLYWDLAVRLMMGSRRDVATRMSAFMALGLMAFTAFGATLVVSINQGLQEMIAESIVSANAQSDGRVKLEYNSRAASQSQKNHERWLKLSGAISDEVKRSGGESISYQMMSFVATPRNNIMAAQVLEVDGARINTISNGTTRAERTAARKEIMEAQRDFYQRAKELGVMNVRVCMLPGHDPEPGTFWSLDRASWGFQSKPSLGATYVLRSSSSGGALSAPYTRSMKLTRLVEPSPKIPTGCNFIAPQSLAASITSREHSSVAHYVEWWGDVDLRKTLSQWNLSNSGIVDSEEFKKEWGASTLWVNSVMWKDYSIASALESELLLSTTRQIAWAVVGVLSLISAYQMCSLLVLLGVHFTSEIALLRSLGMSRASIMWVFLVAASAFALMASVVGASAGAFVTFAFNQWSAQLASLSNSIGMPSIVLSPPGYSFWAIMGGAALFGVLAGLLPSWQASRTDPATIWSQA